MFEQSRAVFKGKVEVDQDFVQGNKTTIEKLVIQVFGGQAKPEFSDAELREQLDLYLRYIRESYRYLDFKGIDSIAEAVKGSSSIALEAVYVPLRARLDTPDGESWHRLGGRYFCANKAVSGQEAETLEAELSRADAAALPVEQWIRGQPALAILGDPGSGKSTSLKRLALGLAQQDNAPLPILVSLNAYGKALDDQPISFEDFLPVYFAVKQSQLRPERLSKLFRGALEQQRAVILMDGLDEVGNNRGQVVQHIQAFVRAWLPDPTERQDNVAPPPGNRMVATSRFVGYREHPLTDPRWLTVALSDWNRAEIDRFFGTFTRAAELAWSGGENRESAERAAETEHAALMAVIDRNTGIRRLAGNPLLASLLALIKRQGVTLPHRRVELYDLYMRTLLRSWNRARSLDGQPVGPEIDFTPTQRLLAKLALHLRQTNPQSGLIHEDAMSDFLVDYFVQDRYTRAEADAKAKDFLDSVHRYSNLLIEKGHRQYGFIHLTFEEYLTGYGMSLEPKDDILAGKVRDFLTRPEHWLESLRLGFGVLAVVNSNQERANVLLSGLMADGDPARVLFAGEVLSDLGPAPLGNRMKSDIQDALLTLGQDSGKPLPIRRRAGLLLGDSVWLPNDLDSLIRIPKGEFRMSDARQIATIVDDFWIGKYPVTNAQYRRFVKDGGYLRREFWSEERWLWREENDVRAPEYWEDAALANPLLPVVGVSWHEAHAYCRWLTESIRTKPGGYGLADTDLGEGHVRLPLSEEWERAARGVDGRQYPWGDGLRPGATNCREAWAESERSARGPSAVHLHLAGQSPDGLVDCAGNIWEWLFSIDSASGKLIAGGSWDSCGGNARCAFRRRLPPGYRINYLGFRVVWMRSHPR